MEKNERFERLLTNARALETRARALEDFLSHLQMDGFEGYRVWITTYNGLSAKICIGGGKEELHDIRARLRRCLGRWSDAMEGIVNVGDDRLVVSYNSTLGHPISIRIEEDARTIDLQSYGLSPSCRLVQREPRFEIQDKWTLECAREEGDEED